MAVRFLSEEWALNATAAFESDPELAEALAGADLLIQFSVTETEEGAVSYFILVEGGRAELSLGKRADADVTLVCDYATAAAISKGELNIQQAYFSGKIDVAGNLAKLIKDRNAVMRLAETVSSLNVEY